MSEPKSTPLTPQRKGAAVGAAVGAGAEGVGGGGGAADGTANEGAGVGAALGMVPQDGRTSAVTVTARSTRNATAIERRGAAIPGGWSGCSYTVTGVACRGAGRGPTSRRSRGGRASAAAVAGRCRRLLHAQQLMRDVWTDEIMTATRAAHKAIGNGDGKCPTAPV